MPAEYDGSYEPIPEEKPRNEAAPGSDASTDAPEPPDLEPVKRQRASGSFGLLPRWLGIAVVVVIASGSLFLAGFTLGARVATTPGTPAALEQQFSPFWDVYNLIKQRYAGGPRPTDQSLIAGAIKGMLQSLNDQWSFYQEPADFQQSSLGVSGHDEGIGVQVQLQGKTSPNCSSDKAGPDCELAVVRPIPGSPAEKAGVKAGDIIAKVDGKSLDGLTLDQITPLIKGKQGTTVTLTLERGPQTLQVPIVRSVFDRPQVDTRALAGGKAEYIDVSQINDVAASQFHDALKQALDAGRRNIVLDLRGNGGGPVNSAVTMASEFLANGVVVYQQDASGQTLATNATPGGLATDPSIKLTVLVDKNTASAAEILAAALQSNGRAKLVGTQTFGKGVAQVWLPLPNNLGGFHLTVARWLTPDHVWINGKGLKPDVPVDSSNALAGTDPVINAALEQLGLPAEPGPSSSPQPSTPQPSPTLKPAQTAKPSMTLSPVPSASGH